jgi:CRP-like cAMP-binding protein
MLAALGPAELEELAQSVTPLRLGRREILYREGGEEPERAGVYVVHRGTVKVFKGRDPDEPKRTLAVLGPGEIFSEMSLIEPGPHRASIITLVAAEVLLINTLGFETMKQRHPGTALKFMEMIARVLVKRLTRTTTKLFSPVRL